MFIIHCDKRLRQTGSWPGKLQKQQTPQNRRANATLKNKEQKLTD